MSWLAITLPMKAMDSRLSLADLPSGQVEQVCAGRCSAFSISWAAAYKMGSAENARRV